MSNQGCFGCGEMISRDNNTRYLPCMVQVELWILAEKQWTVREKFILVHILAYKNFIWIKKEVIIDIEIRIMKTYYSLLKSHLACWIFRKFLRSYVWQRALFKNVTALNAVTSLTLNSDMDIFPQVLQNFQKTASKSEYILS